MFEGRKLKMHVEAVPCRCDPMPMLNDVSGECEEIEVQWCNDGNKNHANSI